MTNTIPRFLKKLSNLVNNENINLSHVLSTSFPTMLEKNTIDYRSRYLLWQTGNRMYAGVVKWINDPE